MNSRKWTLYSALALSSLVMRTTLLAHADELAPPAVRIALVSDPHTTRSEKDDRPLFKKRFEEVIAAVNAAHPDVVVISGDLTDGGLPEQFQDFKDRIKGFVPPVFYVPGNHDIGEKITPGKTSGIMEPRLTSYEATMGASYFVQLQPKVRIIGVNSSLLGSGLPEDTPQWDFLEKELAKRVPVPTVLVMHYPPFLKTADEPGGIYWNLEPEPRARLLDLVKRYHVAAVLSGHLHRPLVNQWEGTAFITTTAVSWGIPAGKQPQGWTQVTIDDKGQVSSEQENIPD